MTLQIRDEVDTYMYLRNQKTQIYSTHAILYIYIDIAGKTHKNICPYTTGWACFSSVTLFLPNTAMSVTFFLQSKTQYPKYVIEPKKMLLQVKPIMDKQIVRGS